MLNEQSSFGFTHDLLVARPFISWLGSKRSILKELRKHVPVRIREYWEPFVGSGAVFFDLAHRLEHATLSDANGELINVYQQIKADPERLHALVEGHMQHVVGKEYFYKLRDVVMDCPVERAAKFLFLMNASFKSRISLKEDGRVVIAKGNDENVKRVSLNELLEVQNVLKRTKASLETKSFDRITPLPGDFVYCDPPYHGSYTGYIAGGFNEQKQLLLAGCARSWADRGANVMLSNADTEYVRGLYAGFNIRAIFQPGQFKDKKDKTRHELIITSY